MALRSIGCLLLAISENLVSSTSSASSAVTPAVTLDNGTFIGTTMGGVDRFLGIPYAERPTGDKRLRLPSPVPAYTGQHTSTTFGPACPQQAFRTDIFPPGLFIDAVAAAAVNTVYNIILPESEDCLMLNVVRPSSASANSKLPVVVWIHGGGFQFGSTASYDGGLVVERSIELKEPIIYVSMNYRLSAFGFLASKEVRDAGLGNLGLQDQRQALRWVQKYISAFGGDPTKVTIWGESAGAISVTMQMLAFNGNTEGLFRAAFMESGGPWPSSDITNGQKFYDQIVAQTGCRGASDTLDCLRTVPFPTFKAAADNLPSLVGFQSLAAPGEPRVDGVFLTDNPQRLVQQGKVPSIPFVTGNCEDEGTVFGLQSLNITTESQFRTYIKNVFVPNISDTDLDTVARLYPENPLLGSPYNTGLLYTLTPQFKRIASVLGDMTLIAPRRFFLQQRSDKQNTWSFLSSRLKTTAILGSFHSSDLLQAYGPSELRDFLIHFVNHLDPNGQFLPTWPKYTTSSPRLMTFTDNIFAPTLLTLDNFRSQAIQFVTNLLLQHPL